MSVNCAHDFEEILDSCQRYVNSKNKGVRRLCTIQWQTTQSHNHLTTTITITIFPSTMHSIPPPTPPSPLSPLPSPHLQSIPPIVAVPHPIPYRRIKLPIRVANPPRTQVRQNPAERFHASVARVASYAEILLMRGFFLIPHPCKFVFPIYWI